MVGGGVFVYGGIFVMLVSFGFWLDVKSLIMFFMYNIGNYGCYFVNIYNCVICFILMFVLLFVFVGVYLVVYFLRKIEWNSYVFVTLIVGVICFMIVIIFWN